MINGLARLAGVDSQGVVKGVLLEVYIDPGVVAVTVVEGLWYVTVEMTQVHHGGSEADPMVETRQVASEMLHTPLHDLLVLCYGRDRSDPIFATVSLYVVQTCQAQQLCSPESNSKL